MKYLCLVYGDQQALDALSKGEMEVLVDESLAYDDVLRRSDTTSSRPPSNASRPRRPCGFGTARGLSRTVRSPRRRNSCSDSS
jgi:hypothetical protein